MVPPKIWYPHCSGGNLPPTGPQGRSRGTFEFVTPNAKNVCHSDRSASGVEESSTLENEPPQDKACYSGRFLDSLRSLGMTCREVFPFNRTGCICHVAGGRLPPLRQCTTFFAFFETQNDDRHVQNAVKWNKCIVGVVLRAANQNIMIAGGNHTSIPSAICRPPRFDYNLWG